MQVGRQCTRGVRKPGRHRTAIRADVAAPCTAQRPNSTHTPAGGFRYGITRRWRCSASQLAKSAQALMFRMLVSSSHNNGFIFSGDALRVFYLVSLVTACPAMPSHQCHSCQTARAVSPAPPPPTPPAVTSAQPPHNRTAHLRPQQHQRVVEQIRRLARNALPPLLLQGRVAQLPRLLPHLARQQLRVAQQLCRPAGLGARRPRLGLPRGDDGLQRKQRALRYGSGA